MTHKGNNDSGPGVIDVSGNTLTYRVGVDELDPFLMSGDTVLIWTDSKLKNITDKAPNTETGDGCAKPQVASEVLTLILGVMSPTGNINGTVTDFSTGNPIDGASVLADTGQSDTTDGTGAYTLSDVPTGDRMVTFSASGYTTDQTPITVTEAGPNVLNFSLVLQPPNSTGTVKGTVRNSAGAKVGSILVTTDPLSNSGTTNKGGKYNIGDVPAGTLSMIADCPFSDQIAIVTVIAGATVTVDFNACD